MYEAFYGFREKPFSLLPDPDYLYLSEQHQMAMTLLEYSLENQAGFCVISGNIGTGKTTLIRYLLNRIGNDISVGLISNTHQSFGELLRWILHAFDLESAGKTKAEMHQLFSDYLIAQYAKNRRTMIIVDEAQNMSPAALEELRMLSNINSEKDLVLQLMLVGQPGLRELLQRPELEQLTQRVAVDYHLKPLSGAETRGYIRHRIGVVGGDPELFSDAACDAVHHYSGGTPRLINLLCDLVLVYAYAEQLTAISRDLVEQVVRERQAHGVLPIFATGALPPERSGDTAHAAKPFAASRPVPVTTPVAEAPRAGTHAGVMPMDSHPAAPALRSAMPVMDSGETASVTSVDTVPPDASAQNETAAASSGAAPAPAASPQNIPDVPATVTGGVAEATPAPPHATETAPDRTEVVESADAASIPVPSTKRWRVAGIAAAVLVTGAASAWWLYRETPSPVSRNVVATPAPAPAPMGTPVGSSATAAPDAQPNTTPPPEAAPGTAAIGNAAIAPTPTPTPPTSIQKPEQKAPATTAKTQDRAHPVAPAVTRRPPASDTTRHQATTASKVAVPAKAEPRQAPTVVDGNLIVEKVAEPVAPAIKTVAEAAPVPVVVTPVVTSPASKPPVSAPRVADSQSVAPAKAATEATGFSADPCKGAAARFLSTCQ